MSHYWSSVQENFPFAGSSSVFPWLLLETFYSYLLSLSSYDANADPFLDKFSWGILIDRRRYHMVYKSLHNLAPDYLRVKFVDCDSVTRYALRDIANKQPSQPKVFGHPQKKALPRSPSFNVATMMSIFLFFFSNLQWGKGSYCPMFLSEIVAASQPCSYHLKNSFRYSGVILWNSLPKPELRQAESICVFKSGYKQAFSNFNKFK